jgi:hypothetical protein
VFTPHLPPSAALPVVLALDSQAEAALAQHVEGGFDPAAGQFHDGGRVVLAAGDARKVDAILGYHWPEDLAALRDRLRPGGRLILILLGTPSDPDDGAQRLEILRAQGYIHCLIEALPDGGWLCRGERPPQQGGGLRLSSLAAGAEGSAARSLVLLIRQSPNKPTWRLEPGERRLWEAARLIDPASGQPALLAFTSLVKAVAFMQPAVLAGMLIGINKTGRYTAEQVAAWNLPVIVNPAFEDWRNASTGEPVIVDPGQAQASEEG